MATTDYQNVSKEEFEQEYRHLDAVIGDLNGRLFNCKNKQKELERAYIATFPFKVNDCVRIKNHIQQEWREEVCINIEKCWIREISALCFFNTLKKDEQPRSEIRVIVDKPKKDGTRSLRGHTERLYNVKLESVEVLESTK